MEPVQKEKLRQQKLKERFDYEALQNGGYELIYPAPDEEKNKLYDGFLKGANEIWDVFTTGNKGHKSSSNLNSNSKMGKGFGMSLGKGSLSNLTNGEAPALPGVKAMFKGV